LANADEAGPMTTICAIDPGPFDSAYTLIDTNNCTPLEFGKVPNDDLRAKLRWTLTDADTYAIEMIASYGMAVGAEVFETCVWIGRFAETIRLSTNHGAELVKRQPIKVHHCGSAKAKDSNIVQALVDRFAPGAPNRGKGTTSNPGWFHGFTRDIWQAYALAVYIADTQTRTAA
jgi:hypothetical protein